MEVKDYVAAIEAAGFVDVEAAPIYWDKETIDAALEQLDPGTAEKVEEAKKQGKTVIVANEGVDGEVVEVNDTMESESFDPQKAVFSAKITARKPK